MLSRDTAATVIKNFSDETRNITMGAIYVLTISQKMVRFIEIPVHVTNIGLSETAAISTTSFQTD